MKRKIFAIALVALMAIPALASTASAANTACGEQFCYCPKKSNIIMEYCSHWAQPIENGRGTFFGCYKHNGGKVVFWY